MLSIFLTFDSRVAFIDVVPHHGQHQSDTGSSSAGRQLVRGHPGRLRGCR